MNDHREGPCCDEFRLDAAAYLLGALERDERIAFEDHLGECRPCRGRVEALRPTVSALAGVTADDLIDAGADAPPISLLPELAQRLIRRRRRQRLLASALGAVAAAALVALAVVLAVRPQSDAPPPAAARTMTVVAASSPVRATAALAGERWGTRIELICDYATGSPYPAAPGTYALRVIDRQGRTHDLGSWTLQPGRVTHFVSGTALREGQIRTVLVTLRDGTAVLRLATT